MKEKKPHNCPICDKAFNWKAHLISHISGVHEGNKPHECSLCDKMLKSSGALKYHITSIHERKKNTLAIFVIRILHIRPVWHTICQQFMKVLLSSANFVKKYFHSKVL